MIATVIFVTAQANASVPDVGRVERLGDDIAIVRVTGSTQVFHMRDVKQVVLDA